jgi:hypothetical protein
MTRPLTAWAVALALALPNFLAAADAPPDPELARGIRQVEDGEFDAAVLTLDAVARRAKDHGGAASELARAQLYLGVAYAGLRQEATAKARFVQALENDRSLTLSARKFPPRVIELFDEARLEVGAAPRAAVAPTPAPPPSGKKGGVSKGLLVGLGAAAAAGVAIAVAAGGGGGPSTSPSPSPSPSTSRPRAVISGVVPEGQYLTRVTRVSFSGRQSSDPEGHSLRYSWDFGDGSAPQTAGDVAHTFNRVCTCTVRLTVTDSMGLTDTASLVITSRQLDGSWRGHYSGGNLGDFSVVLNQGSTNFSGPLSDGSEMRGTLSDPRDAHFLIDDTPRPNCLASRSFEGTLSPDLNRIDATGESCSGAQIGLVLTR